MEKNWIEKIKEAVRVAMNKGLDLIGTRNFPYNIVIKNEICIYIYKDRIIVNTQHGYIKIEHSLTDSFYI